MPVHLRETIGERLAGVRARIAAACARAGRRPDEVTLLGVSKTQAPAAVLAAYEAGLTTFGENRVQEAAAKARELPADIEWHLIGPLQTNKARLAAGVFAAVHSVDRPRVAEALEQEMSRLDRRKPVFAEINLGAEASKHGFAPAGLIEALMPIAALDHLELVGLMAIPPFAEEPEASRPWFRQLRALRDELRASGRLPGFRGWLSMGMSGDFEVAIEEGATHVRVGTAIFGERPSADHGVPEPAA